MRKKILVFTDCDGTLLFDDYQFSPLTIQTTKEIYEQGHMLIPVTARTLKNLKNLAKQLKLDQLGGIIAANNGSQIYDFKTKKLIYNAVLDRTIITTIFNHYYKPDSSHKEDKVNFISEDFVYSYGESPNTIRWAEVMEQQFKTITAAEQITTDLTNIYIVTKKGTSPAAFAKHLKEIETKYGQDYCIDHYHNRVISIAPKHTDKGYAVEIILKYLGKHSYQTFAFGDSFNDLSLLAAVDCGVAMKNGINELKACADDVTNYNHNEDGVCRYLKENNII